MFFKILGSDGVLFPLSFWVGWLLIFGWVRVKRAADDQNIRITMGEYVAKLVTREGLPTAGQFGARPISHQESSLKVLGRRNGGGHHERIG